MKRKWMSAGPSVTQQNSMLRATLCCQPHLVAVCDPHLLLLLSHPAGATAAGGAAKAAETTDIWG